MVLVVVQAYVLSWALELEKVEEARLVILQHVDRVAPPCTAAELAAPELRLSKRADCSGACVFVLQVLESSKTQAPRQSLLLSDGYNTPAKTKACSPGSIPYSPSKQLQRAVS